MAENVVTGTVGLRTAEALESHYHVKTIIGAPDDVGYGCVSRVRGVTFGLSMAAGRWIGEPQVLYDKICRRLACVIDSSNNTPTNWLMLLSLLMLLLVAKKREQQ